MNYKELRVELNCIFFNDKNKDYRQRKKPPIYIDGFCVAFWGRVT